MWRTIRRLVALSIVLLGIFALFYLNALKAPGGRPQYIRYNEPESLNVVLTELEAKGVIKSARASSLLARITGQDNVVGVGTYQVSGGRGARSNLYALAKPMVQMVRLPETNWAKRTANVLEKVNVSSAEDYIKEVNHPGGRTTGFPLPADTLEGYLYPDTYDLPPLIGAKAVVGKQLDTFEKKVWEPLHHPKDLDRILKVASLVQLEAGRDDERPIIAGVIENRLKKGMRLQIDASILYGLGKWRRLTFRDYREVDSPYNLYRHSGLPPTPICSPSIASIRAAMSPARHNYLYYVALPDGSSLFAATYEEHKKNIEKRKAALKQ